MIPFRTPFFLPHFYPSLTWRITTEKKELFLTFDDGPVTGPTEFVLDVLQSKSAKATFFCIGDNIRKHAAVFKRIISEGHAVGNHTYNHVNGWKSNTSDYVRNVKLCSGEMKLNTTDNFKKEFFRPPYGRITRSQIKALADYKIIMWDVLTHDYSQTLSEESCLKKSINATRNGSVIVFHDSIKAERNLRFALPRFIDHFTALGYEFKTLSI